MALLLRNRHGIGAHETQEKGQKILRQERIQTIIYEIADGEFCFGRTDYDD